MNLDQHFQTLTNFTPRQFQIETITQILNGENIILRAPTGSGKTETAIAPFLFAKLLNPHFPQKLIYVVPLRTLANSLRQRTEKLVENWSKVHSLPRPLTVTLQTGENPEDPRFEGDMIFCTIDQMLSSFVNIPYSVGRGSANINSGVFFASYLVFDEIHLLDPDRSFTSLIKVLEQVNGIVPFLLMTATLTEELATQLQKTISYPTPTKLLGVNEQDLTEIEGDRQRTLTAISEPLTASQIIQNLPQRAIAICNTVSQAQGLFQELQAIISARSLDIDLTLLHSRFLAEDRREKEEKLRVIFSKNPSLGSAYHILIATQVIEAGLDLSCDVMHIHLCPMNSLLQRTGRCARFTGEKGTVYIYPDIEVGQDYQAVTENDLEPKETKTRQYLPYTKEICEKTWEVLQSHLSGEVGYKLEATWINQVHDASDRLQLERRNNNRAEFDEQFNNALFSGDESAASRLIRQVNSRSVYVWEENSLIDFNDDEAEIDPQTLQAFSLPLTTLGRIWAQFQRQEYVTDWLFKRISTPKRKETYSQAICTPIVTHKELVNSFRILVNPRFLSYDADIGLQIGIDITGNSFQSPKKADKSAINQYKYEMDTYIAHLGSMVQCWRNPFSTYVSRNGKEIKLQYLSVKGELGGAGGRFLKSKIFSDATLEDTEALFEILVFLAIFCHDLGKLQLQWQQVMQGWQAIAHNQFNGKSHGNHLLAHTDFDPRDAKQKELYQPTKKSLPNHAVESAYLSREILIHSLAPILQTRFTASREQIGYIIHTIVLASGRHHSAWAKSFKNKQIQLHPQAKETIDLAWKRLSRFLPKSFILPIPSLSQDCYKVLKDFELKGFTDLELPYHQLYALVVRALRLCDQRSVQR